MRADGEKVKRQASDGNHNVGVLCKQEVTAVRYGEDAPGPGDPANCNRVR